MKYVSTEHLFEVKDVNIFFFLKTWSKLDKFDLGQSRSELQFGTKGVHDKMDGQINSFSLHEKMHKANQCHT